MTPEVRRRLHFWYGIFMSALTAVVAILFISQAADIYYSGHEFTRELVAERCAAIAAPFWIWIAAIIIGGAVLSIYPLEKKKLKRLPDARGDVNRLTRLTAADKSEDSEFFELANQVHSENKRTRIIWYACLLICAVCAGIILGFAFNFEAYPSDPNEAVLRLVAVVMPCCAAAFIICCGVTIYDAVSARKILPKAKRMLALGGRAPKENSNQNTAQRVLSSPITLLVARVVVFALAVAFIIWGVLNGSMYDVFAKAIKICTECIGLG